MTSHDDYKAFHKQLNADAYTAKPGTVKCDRCRRYTPWNIPGEEICGRCRDVGVKEGWLLFDAANYTFHKNPYWSPK